MDGGRARREEGGARPLRSAAARAGASEDAAPGEAGSHVLALRRRARDEDGADEVVGANLSR